MTSRRHAIRAVELLNKIVASGLIARETLARELVVTEHELDGFLGQTIAMPLDRQLCLALFVIEKVPPLSRLGYRLKGQVNAAFAFKSQSAVIHADAPPRLFR